MERNDFGTDGAIDDVSFAKGDAKIGTSGLEGSSIPTATADASGDANPADSVSIEPPPTTSTGKLAAAKQKVGAAKERVVDGMHATADWIKSKDVDAVKGGIEAQVRDHPGRTLLIAVGLGYLIGRAFRGNGV